MDFADSAGLRIHQQSHGSGRPIALVHGWDSDMQHNWVSSGWVEVLRPIRRVTPLDCRGLGRSDKPHERKGCGYGAVSRDLIADETQASAGACVAIAAGLRAHDPAPVADPRFKRAVLEFLG